MSQVATEMTMDYCANLLTMGVDQISSMPRATDHISQIIEFIASLMDKGFAYESVGDVFFDVTRDPDYGKLSNRSADEQQGEGGEAATRKRSPADFALWKSARPGEPAWPSPWGNGRPGWHIECSAMSRELLGETFDIHGGGLDLIFPHHENEIAQSESCHGAPMARYWMHNGLLRAGDAAGKVGGRGDEGASAGKMSRSAGAGGLRGLLARHGGERVRYFLLRTHYRSTIVFGDEAIAEAGTALDKFYVFFERYQRITGRSYYLDPSDPGESRRLIRRRADGSLADEKHPLLGEVASYRQAFLSKMDDDFNSGAASSELFPLLSVLNRFADSQHLEDPSVRNEADLRSFTRAVETLRELTAVLGLFLKPTAAPPSTADSGLTNELMRLLIEVRQTARASKNFAIADQIRDELSKLNITLEDRKGESSWRREGAR
jgi:cysteinyl-tRNA synthetase